MSEGFRKNEKLKSEKHFNLLFSDGKSVHSFPIRLVYIPIENAENLNKIGVSAPKRKFKRAVDRNKAKRLMRESFRKNKYLFDHLEQKYALLFIFVGGKIVSYEEVFSSVQKLLHKFVEQVKIEVS